MEKWATGIFCSIGAGLGAGLDAVNALNVPTVHLHAPGPDERGRSRAREIKREFAAAGVGISVVFVGFPEDDYSTVERVVETVGLVPEGRRHSRVGETLEIADFAAELGVDMIQWGPSDFGFSRPSTPTPEEIQYHETQVIKTALAKGIRPRVEMEFPTPEKLDHYTELGIKDYCVMWDRGTLSGAWKKTGTALKDELASRWSQYY